MQRFEVAQEAVAQIRDARLGQLEATVLEQLGLDLGPLLASKVTGQPHVYDKIVAIALMGFD